jgi:hypothetical protein
MIDHEIKKKSLPRDRRGKSRQTLKVLAFLSEVGSQWSHCESIVSGVAVSVQDGPHGPVSKVTNIM